MIKLVSCAIVMLVVGSTARSLSDNPLDIGKPVRSGPSNTPSASRQGGDDISGATSISTVPYNDAGSTSGYVDDYDESCPSTSTSPDVVYSFVATVDTFLYITLCNGSTYDTKLFVYEDAAGNLVD